MHLLQLQRISVYAIRAFPWPQKVSLIPTITYARGVSIRAESVFRNYISLPLNFHFYTDPCRTRDTSNNSHPLAFSARNKVPDSPIAPESRN